MKMIKTYLLSALTCIFVATLVVFSGQAQEDGGTHGESTDCRIPCQLGINQTEPLSVQDFLDALLAHDWIQEDTNRTLHAMYARDTFSNVLETTTSILLDGGASNIYLSEIHLYIGNVGGIVPDDESIPSETIEAIEISTNIPISVSWLFYGLPEGGMIFPLYLPEDIDESNPCPDRSHYIAYHDAGNTIIRAVVERPILINIWTTPVEIVFPIGEELAFSSWWIGRFDRMDHTPCMID